MVVGGDHQRDILGIESRHLEDHRILAQVQHAADVQRVVVGPRDLPHRVVFQLGIGVTGIPSALLERELVVHVVHGNVLIRPPHDVLDLLIAEDDGFLRHRGCRHHRHRKQGYAPRANFPEYAAHHLASIEHSR
jgi:hypothetical protein